MKLTRSCECAARGYVDGDGQPATPVVVTCGECGRTWCDRCTGTHGPRCPFEYEHDSRGLDARVVQVPDEYDLAEALAAMDRHPQGKVWSFQEQADFIRRHLRGEVRS